MSWIGFFCQLAATGVLIWAILQQVKWTRRLEKEYRGLRESAEQAERLMDEIRVRKQVSGEEIAVQLQKEFGETN